MNIVKYASLLSVSLVAALYGTSVYGMELIKATKLGNLEAVEALILSGANINQQDAEGKTALNWAAISVSICIAGTLARTLITAHANVNLADMKKSTPLHSAACINNIAVIHELIAAGANPNAQNVSGATPLHYAAFHAGGAIAVQKLLAAGANPNAQDDIGRTPLHDAAYSMDFRPLDKSIAIVQALIASGAHLNITDQYGTTPLQVARLAAAEGFNLQASLRRIDDATQCTLAPLDNALAMITLLTKSEQRINEAKQRVRNHIANTFALAMHGRLGADSPLALLPADGEGYTLLRNISKLIADSEEYDARQPRP